MSRPATTPGPCCRRSWRSSCRAAAAIGACRGRQVRVGAGKQSGAGRSLWARETPQGPALGHARRLRHRHLNDRFDVLLDRGLRCEAGAESRTRGVHGSGSTLRRWKLSAVLTRAPPPYRRRNSGVETCTTPRGCGSGQSIRSSAPSGAVPRPSSRTAGCPQHSSTWTRPRSTARPSSSPGHGPRGHHVNSRRRNVGA
jgi:hypothetical protein